MHILHGVHVFRNLFELASDNGKQPIRRLLQFICL